LGTFIYQNGLIVKESMLGLVYRLPDFYDYDIEIDENVKSKVDIKISKPSHTKEVDTLIPLTKIARISRNVNRFEYWFKRSNGNAVCLYLTKDNPLMHIWDRLFNKNETLKISGVFSTTKIDNFQYFKLSGWELDNG